MTDHEDRAAPEEPAPRSDNPLAGLPPVEHDFNRNPLDLGSLETPSAASGGGGGGGRLFFGIILLVAGTLLVLAGGAIWAFTGVGEAGAAMIGAGGAMLPAGIGAVRSS